MSSKPTPSVTQSFRFAGRFLLAVLVVAAILYALMFLMHSCVQELGPEPTVIDGDTVIPLEAPTPQ